MRILITGINGFIGQQLAEQLIKRRHNVVGLSRSKRCKVNNIKTYHSGSVLDKKLVEKATRHVEAVIHLAALTSHETIVENKFETLETNFLGTKNILDAFSKSKNSRKFLYASSGKVYGNIINLPIREDHPTNPQNILGKGKLITEKLIDFYNENNKKNQKEFIIFRIFNIYGPGQRKNFLIPTILGQLKYGKKEKEIVLGDVEAKRDWVYIDDVVNAFILAIEGKAHKGLWIFNICTDFSSSASHIVKLISKIKGINIKVKVNSLLIRHDEEKDEYGSFERAKKYLGWEPKVNIREGLQRLLN